MVPVTILLRIGAWLVRDDEQFPAKWRIAAVFDGFI
jgi:hypothetical protein